MSSLLLRKDCQSAASSWLANISIETGNGYKQLAWLCPEQTNNHMRHHVSLLHTKSLENQQFARNS